MAGAYCTFCDNRCFVYRIVPDGPCEDWRGHMATCPAGMAHDRAVTGHDHSTAINPAGLAFVAPLFAVPEPNACRHCDEPQRMHCQRWTLTVGWHRWAAPTDDQRLARMLARRA